MNTFITLHRVYKDPVETLVPIHINVDNLICYYPLLDKSFTCVCCKGDYEFYVKETCEEIIEMLND